jgi:succinate dehydrogenase hydrophobic anchor subunit
MSFSTIQLMEYGLWDNLEDTSKNEKWSDATLLVLTSISILATLTIENPKLRKTALFCAILYFALVLFTSERDRLTTLGEDQHLNYTFLPKTRLYSVGWFLFFFGSILAGSNHGWLKSYSVLSLLVSYFIVQYNGSFNSYWCYTAVGIWLVATIQSSSSSESES